MLPRLELVADPSPQQLCSATRTGQPSAHHQEHRRCTGVRCTSTSPHVQVLHLCCSPPSVAPGRWPAPDTMCAQTAVQCRGRSRGAGAQVLRVVLEGGRRSSLGAVNPGRSGGEWSSLRCAKEKNTVTGGPLVEANERRGPGRSRKPMRVSWPRCRGLPDLADSTGYE